MTYGQETFGFGEALRICLGGGMAARRGWEEGAPRPGDEIMDYPAGSYVYQDKGAGSGVIVQQEKETGNVRPLFAMSSVCLMVHKPGHDPDDVAWCLHSLELFALDWVEVFK